MNSNLMRERRKQRLVRRLRDLCPDIAPRYRRRIAGHLAYADTGITDTQLRNYANIEAAALRAKFRELLGVPQTA